MVEIFETANTMAVGQPARIFVDPRTVPSFTPMGVVSLLALMLLEARPRGDYLAKTAVLQLGNSAHEPATALETDLGRERGVSFREFINN